MLYVDIENGNGIPSSIVTSSGTVSFNTSYIRGEMSFFYVKAASSDTQFDVKIIDKRGRVVRHYQKEGADDGTLRDEDKIGMMGKYTITIENATKDEAFQVHMKVQEIH